MMDRPQVATVAGRYVLVVPVEICPGWVRFFEAACSTEARAAGGGWSPAPDLVEMLAILRKAPIVADLGGEVPNLEPSERTAPPIPHDERMPLTASETASRLGVSSRRIRTMAVEGQLPGARRTRAGWSIPAQAVDGALRRRKAS